MGVLIIEQELVAVSSQNLLERIHKAAAEHQEIIISDWQGTFIKSAQVDEDYAIALLRAQQEGAAVVFASTLPPGPLALFDPIDQTKDIIDRMGLSFDAENFLNISQKPRLINGAQPIEINLSVPVTIVDDKEIDWASGNFTWVNVKNPASIKAFIDRDTATQPEAALELGGL